MTHVPSRRSSILPRPAGRFFSLGNRLQVRPRYIPPRRRGHSPARIPGQRGQALILIVFAIVGLVAITGLAVDGGNAFSDRRQAQNAADAAAMAGALGRINGQAWVDTVRAVAASNGYNNNGKTNVVEVHSPPISGPNKGDIEYIQVRITSHVRTYFAAVIGQREITNVVEAVARSKPSVLGPLFNGNAVVSLAPASDCLLHQSFYVHAEATLAIWGGGVLINSANRTCAMIQRGNGSIRINDVYPIRITGGFNIQKPNLITPYPPISGNQSMPYPPPVYMPKVGCGSKEAKVSEDGKSISDGNWGDDDFPPPGVTHLESGKYCLDGNFVIAGARQIEGTGVTINVQHGQVRWSGAAVIELTAPRTGTLKGLLMYQPIENRNTMVLNAEEGSKIRGTILAPGAPIIIKGNDSDYGFHGQLIGYSFDVDGQSNVVIRFLEEDNYQAWTMPEVQFTK